MKTRSSISLVALLAAFCSAATCAKAQTGFGVTAGGFLFKFQLSNPGTVAVIGNIGFIPEGIDFRPSSNTLYAINIGPSTTQLFTLDITTGAVTAVGSGFPSSGNVGGVPYDLTTAGSFGFDFNPTTLQGDGSMRIRLIAGNNNLRLNSSTGQIVAVDTQLNYPPGDPNAGSTVRVDGVAYTNNIAATSGTTRLFDLDFLTDVLAEQTLPNSGALHTVGSTGLSGTPQSGIGFDIYTDGSGDHAFAMIKRGGVASGAYRLYDVNLATGALTNPRAVGSDTDFAGGFAVTLLAPTLQSAVSRKVHGAAGTFDIDLPLTGTPGIECRGGGATNDYQMVTTFSGNVTVSGNPQAEVISGTGAVGTGGTPNGGMVTISGNMVTIPLTNVANAQTINVRLNGVNNASADAISVDVTIPMSLLVGDTNANGAVNATDLVQTKSRTGQLVTTTNFRSDVDANASINSTDVLIIKSNAGTGLP